MRRSFVILFFLLFLLFSKIHLSNLAQTYEILLNPDRESATWSVTLSKGDKFSFNFRIFGDDNNFKFRISGPSNSFIQIYNISRLGFNQIESILEEPVFIENETYYFFLIEQEGNYTFHIYNSSCVTTSTIISLYFEIGVNSNLVFQRELLNEYNSQLTSHGVLLFALFTIDWGIMREFFCKSNKRKFKPRKILFVLILLCIPLTTYVFGRIVWYSRLANFVKVVDPLMPITINNVDYNVPTSIGAYSSLVLEYTRSPLRISALHFPFDVLEMFLINCFDKLWSFILFPGSIVFLLLLIFLLYYEYPERLKSVIN